MLQSYLKKSIARFHIIRVFPVFLLDNGIYGIWISQQRHQINAIDNVYNTKSYNKKQ